MLKLLRIQSQEFLSHLSAKNRSSNTIRFYKADLQIFFDFWQEKETQKGVALTIKQVLTDYFVHMYKIKLNNNTHARKISTFRSFEQFLFDKGIVLDLKLKNPRLIRRLPSVLSTNDITVILNDSKKKSHNITLRDLAILELLYSTGIRPSELRSIKIQDVDFEKSLIHITGKNKRFVIFGMQASKKIQRYLEKERTKTYHPEDFLFTNESNSNPINERSLNEIFVRLKKALNITKQLTPKILRNSFAAHLLDEDMDLRIVQKLLGHKEIKNTQNYERVALKKLRKINAHISLLPIAY